MESLERMALRPSTNARPRPATQGGDLEGGVDELRSDCGPGGDPSGGGGCTRWVFALHARRAVGIPQLWAGHRVSEGHTGTPGRQRGFCALGVVSVAGGLAAQGSARLENPRAMQRKVNRDGDHHSQAVLERHGSRTGTVFPSIPGPTLFRSGALPVKR
jgi:hypothetical protein